jgi:2-polyprenyl-6-methoxyphenol hydroxylase-like FAD-dependent oxidoreductase
VGKAQHFAVFEFKTDWDHEGQMRVVMDNGTTNVLWPLTDGFCRWSFELHDYEATMASRIKDRLLVQVGDTQYPLLSENDLKNFIRDRAPWFDGSIDDIAWRLVVRFEKRLASSFGKDRMWLVGDAGHMTGPVGIQSMNVGLREANDLADAVAAFIEGKGSAKLERYQEERQQEWRFLLGLKGGLAPTSGVDPWLATRADRLISCMPASGSDLHKLARQMGFEVSARPTAVDEA